MTLEQAANAERHQQSIPGQEQQAQTYWQFGSLTLIILALSLLVMGWAYYDGLLNLVGRWEAEEEYNHGYFMPMVTVTFLWQLWPRLSRDRFQPAWAAPALALIALMIFAVGELSAIFLLIHYSFILVLFALSLALFGWRGTRLTFAPLAILVFAIPIPYFLEATITSKLQLISSMFGVKLIRWCNIPVFREGNLIDLGVFKLEVIEACSGLTYLYPLLGFGAICAYVYHTETWKRVLLIFSTIPIAILLNSFRIGMIGFLVKYFGNEQAQGFLHDFEGFAVFMLCVAILFVEIWALTFVGKDRRPFSAVFGLTFEAVEYTDQSVVRQRPFSMPLLATFLLIVVTSFAIHAIGTRTEIKPERAYFSSFPLSLGDWHGTQDVLGTEVLKTLDLSDYLLADYKQDNSPLPVNFYVAYYQSQRKGSSPHSPLVCLPGGGWQITTMEKKTFPGSEKVQPFEFNRVVIRKGKTRQLVYYWFDERGRIITDEYQAKWYLLRDAIVQNRTDGALVRVITPIAAGESEAKADQRILGLLKQALPVIPDFVPR